MALGLNDLAGEVLGWLTRTGIAQAHDSEDVEYIVTRAPYYLAELEGRTGISIPDTDDLDLAYYLALAQGLGNEVAPHFGGTVSAAIRDDAEDRMKVVSRRGGVSDNKLKVDVAIANPPGLSLARWTSGG